MYKPATSVAASALVDVTSCNCTTKHHDTVKALQFLIHTTLQDQDVLLRDPQNVKNLMIQPSMQRQITHFCCVSTEEIVKLLVWV